MKSRCHLFFETLGNRLKIDIILKLKEKPFSVGELSRSLNQERSKVSHALKTLLECRLVGVKKTGRKRTYSLNTYTITPLLNLVERHIKKYCKICKRNIM